MLQSRWYRAEGKEHGTTVLLSTMKVRERNWLCLQNLGTLSQWRVAAGKRLLALRSPKGPSYFATSSFQWNVNGSGM